MVEFTLYIFTRVFELTYTGSKKLELQLVNFFDRPREDAEALSRVVTGKTSGVSWKTSICVNADQCECIDSDRVRYVYRKIRNKAVYELDDNFLIEELLNHAIGKSQHIQTMVYQSKESDETKKYISSLKNMEDEQYRSDDIFIEAQEEKISSDSTYNATSDSLISTLQFYEGFKEQLKNDNVAEVCIAFHGGSDWLNPNSVKYPILKAICEKGIPIQIAVNRADVAEDIAKHMRDLNAYNSDLYVGFEKNINRWKSFLINHKNNYTGRVKPELKLVQIPLLHSYVCYVTKDKVHSQIKVVYYTYANSYYKRNPYRFFNIGTDEYDLYRDEFKYLWEKYSDKVDL